MENTFNPTEKGPMFDRDGYASKILDLLKTCPTEHDENQVLKGVIISIKKGREIQREETLGKANRLADSISELENIIVRDEAEDMPSQPRFN